jgi:hypothetical protein
VTLGARGLAAADDGVWLPQGALKECVGLVLLFMPAQILCQLTLSAGVVTMLHIIQAQHIMCCACLPESHHSMPVKCLQSGLLALKT